MTDHSTGNGRDSVAASAAPLPRHRTAPRSAFFESAASGRENAPATPAGGGAAALSPTAELETRVKLAELEQRLAEIKRKTAEAALPKSDLKALEGTTTLDQSVTTEVEMLAHEAVEYIAAAAATEIKKVINDPNAVIVIYDRETFAAMRLLDAFSAATRLLARGYRAEPGAAGSEAFSLEPVTAVAKTALDLIALFRQDTSYFGRKVSVGHEALVAMLATRLAPTRVVVPSYGLAGPSAAHGVDVASTIVEQLSILYGAQARATARVDAAAGQFHLLGVALRKAEARQRKHAARLAWLEVELPGLTGDPATDARAEIEALRTETIPQAESDVAFARFELERLSAEIDRSRGSLQAANQSVDDLSRALTLSAPGTSSLLSVLVSAERLARSLAGREYFVLAAEVVTAGGSYRVRRNLFTNLFWGDLLRYSGGAVATYSLFNSAHEIVASNALRYMTGHSKFKKLRPVPRGANFAVPGDV